MPIFKVDIEKVDSVSYFWTNVYHIRAASIDAAHSAAVDIIAPAEAAIHASFITVVKARTSTITENDEVFRTALLDLDGGLSTTGNALPLFNVVRLIGNVDEGRPSSKYYKCGLGGGDVVGGYRWDGAKLTAILAEITAMRDELTAESVPWVDPQDQIILDLITQARIGMHQLRRGSKRKTEPVLP